MLLGEVGTADITLSTMDGTGMYVALATHPEQLLDGGRGEAPRFIAVKQSLDNIILYLKCALIAKLGGGL